MVGTYLFPLVNVLEPVPSIERYKIVREDLIIPKPYLPEDIRETSCDEVKSRLKHV